MTLALRPMRWWDVEAALPLEAELFGAEAWSAETWWGELAHAGDGGPRWYVVAESGDALVGYFFDERAGLVGRARAGTLLDAPVMTAAHEETISWGRPTWGLSLCAALRL